MPVSSVRTWCAILPILSVLTVHTVQYGKGMRSVGIGDGDLRAARHSGSSHGRGNTVCTILTICSIVTVGSVGTRCAILPILTVLPVHAVQHGESVRAVGIGDGDLRAARNGGGGHSGRNTVGTILTICSIVPVSSVRTWCAVLAILPVGTVLAVNSIQYGEGMRSVGIGDGDLCAASYGGSGHGGGNTVGPVLSIRTIVSVGSVGTRCAVLSILTVLTVHSVQYSEGMRSVGIGDGDLRAARHGGGGHGGRNTVGTRCASCPGVALISLISFVTFITLFALRTLCPSCPGVALISFVTFIPLFALWTLWTLCPGITFITLIALVSLVTFVAFRTTDALHADSERCG